jgi:hypothetical protein
MIKTRKLVSDYSYSEEGTSKKYDKYFILKKVYLEAQF